MKNKKIMAYMMTFVIVVGLAACATKPAGSGTAGDGKTEDPYADPYKTENKDPYADPYKNQNNDPYADPYKTGGGGNAGAGGEVSAEEYMPEAGEHFTVEKTADGWIEIVNEGGEKLGL